MGHNLIVVNDVGIGNDLNVLQNVKVFYIILDHKKNMTDIVYIVI
jgi:hypothetical protein